MIKAQLLWQAITPVHVGTGQNSSGVIDLPIAREAGTQYPYIPASSIKGVLRDREDLDGTTQFDCQQTDTPAVTDAQRRFGYAISCKKGCHQVSAAGDLSFTDAHILCLPVASFAGTYALVTCPLVLRRVLRDRRLLGLTTREDVPAPDPDKAYVIAGSPLTIPNSSPEKIILNDLDFSPQVTDDLAPLWILITGIDETKPDSQRLCLVSDDVFAFLCETSLEITPHISLERETKTVKPGGLWYQESLPAETLMTSFLMSDKGDLSVIDRYDWLQLGGKSTTGQGMMALSKVALNDTKETPTSTENGD